MGRPKKQVVVETATAVAATSEDGRWVKGVSGNPSGRPPSRRDTLLERKQTLEDYIRGRIDKEKAVKAVSAMIDMASSGDTKAAAVIIPYILSKATDAEETSTKHPGGIVIRIENATVKAQREAEPIEGAFKEITHERPEHHAV